MAMTLANGMILIDQTAVPITLPDIMHTFRVRSQEAQWVLSGSLLALAALLVLGGRLGDLLGRRRGRGNERSPESRDPGLGASLCSGPGRHCPGVRKRSPNSFSERSRR
jgi:MFS family permease